MTTLFFLLLPFTLYGLIELFHQPPSVVPQFQGNAMFTLPAWLTSFFSASKLHVVLVDANAVLVFLKNNPEVLVGAPAEFKAEIERVVTVLEEFLPEEAKPETSSTK